MVTLTTLRPGLLVSLKTSVIGNIDYERRTLDADHTTADGGLQARWETTRTIADPTEHAEAQKVRSEAGHIIRKICTQSAFGLLCPEDKANALEQAIADAHALTDEFNAKAALTRVRVYVIAGRVAANDVEAVKAINSEIRDLMTEMENGLANLDVKTVRAAASKAREMGQMLSSEASARVQLAVDLARQSAKQIVKAGEQAAQEIDRQTIKRIAEQRTAFLDLDGPAPEISGGVTEPGRAVDFAPAAE
jgi:oligoendopeptidase F